MYGKLILKSLILFFNFFYFKYEWVVTCCNTMNKMDVAIHYVFSSCRVGIES